MASRGDGEGTTEDSNPLGSLQALELDLGDYQNIRTAAREIKQENKPLDYILLLEDYVASDMM